MGYRLEGLVAATFTPCHADGSLDLPSVSAHAAELARQGVGIAFCTGTTGEGATMSVAERCAVTERWLEVAPATGLRVTVHVGAEAISDTLALARHAEARAVRAGVAGGIEAIAVIAPTYNKPPTLDALVELLALVAAAAPSLPLYYYHIAIKTGVVIRCDQLLERIHAVRAARVPTFAGIKYSDADLHIFANCLAFAGGAYDMLPGKDEQLLGFLAMGAKGAVGSTYNYQGREYNALIAAHARGDAAEALRLTRITQVAVDLLLTPERWGGAGVNTGKALMELRLGGKHTGPPRYPSKPMPEDAKARLREAAEACGFFAGLQAQ